MDAIRKAKPDLILTHPPEDYMPDHTVTSQLVFDASFEASLPQLTSEHAFHPKVPPIYYMDTVAGVDFQPDDYVDITEHFVTKKAMLACHRSQLQWIRDHDHVDFMDFMETQSKFRGYQSGAGYAEAFRVARRWPRMTTERMLP